MASFANDQGPCSSVNPELSRSPRLTVVVCSKAKLPAEVGLDAAQNIESCSRWNGSSDCSQTCLPQIRFCAESLQEFREQYVDKTCGSCGAPLIADDWYDIRLGLGLRVVKDALGAAIPRGDNPICPSCFRGRMRSGGS